MLREQMQRDLESLGWQCHESEAGEHWTVRVNKGEIAIVSTGRDRQLVWNAAYRDALRHCGMQSA